MHNELSRSYCALQFSLFFVANSQTGTAPRRSHAECMQLGLAPNATSDNGAGLPELSAFFAVTAVALALSGY